MASRNVVTGEAVVLQLTPATVFVRMAAALIDAFISVLAFVGLVLLYTSIRLERFLDGAGIEMVMLLSVIFMVAILPGSIEFFSRGRSIGKLIFGLKVVRDDGGTIRPRHVVARYTAGFLELWLTVGGLALLISSTNDRGKRLGDMIGGSYVMTVRVGKLPAPLPPVPAQLRGWADIADVGNIPDHLALPASQLLRQARMMHPAHMERVASELAAQIQPYVHPLPPAQLSATDFLFAVMALRRERDIRSLQDRRATQQRIAHQLEGSGQHQ